MGGASAFEYSPPISLMLMDTVAGFAVPGLRFFNISMVAYLILGVGRITGNRRS